MKIFLKHIFLILFLTSISTFAYSQFETDSIRINHNQDITYHTRKIDFQMVDHLMTPYPDAKMEMRSAITNRFWSRFMLFTSTALLFIPLHEAINGDPISWEPFALSAGFAVISLPFYSAKKGHLNKAIDLYNAKVTK